MAWCILVSEMSLDLSRIFKVSKNSIWLSKAAINWKIQWKRNGFRCICIRFNHGSDIRYIVSRNSVFSQSIYKYTYVKTLFHFSFSVFSPNRQQTDLLTDLVYTNPVENLSHWVQSLPPYSINFNQRNDC